MTFVKHIAQMNKYAFTSILFGVILCVTLFMLYIQVISRNSAKKSKQKQAKNLRSAATVKRVSAKMTNQQCWCS